MTMTTAEAEYQHRVDAVLAEERAQRKKEHDYSTAHSAATAKAKLVKQKAAELEVLDDARALVRERRSGMIELPPQLTLREFLSESTEPARWRIEGLAIEGGNVLLDAKAKSGKTTVRDNLIRSLADGDDFLGRFPVRPVQGRIAVVDFELPRETMRDWLRAQNIDRLDAVEPVPMKGMARRFDLRDDRVRAAWAERFAGVSVLVIDALAPWLTAFGMKEATEAGDILPGIDDLKEEAGIGEAFLIVHQGHGAERARGDSRLLGWPDALWSLNREEKGETRFLSAYGRDVTLGETALNFDPTSKRLTIGEGDRQDAAALRALQAIVLAIEKAGEAMASVRIEEAFADSKHSRDDVRAALKLGRETGRLTFTKGARGAHLYGVRVGEEK